jgi:osmotically inducible protein OsmC
MSIRSAETTWTGTLREGAGNMKVGSGLIDVPFTFATRFGDEDGTNPEELVGAALAGCFTMSVSANLTKAGLTPGRLHTDAAIHFGRDDTGALIEKIVLTLAAEAPGATREQFDEAVAAAKTGCPISRALSGGPEIEVHATLA